MLSQAHVREQAHIGRVIAVAALTNVVVEAALLAEAELLLTHAADAGQSGHAAVVAALALLPRPGGAGLAVAEPPVGARHAEAVAGLARRRRGAGPHRRIGLHAV